jgi:DNA-directed RNA polymerase specialized sigma24 family protein
VTGRARDQGTEELAQAFEAQRPRLVRLAYATTGSLAEAEDCVQEAWLRLRRVPDPGSIRDLGAWLTTTVSRLALDALAARGRGGSATWAHGCPSRWSVTWAAATRRTGSRWMSR